MLHGRSIPLDRLVPVVLLGFAGVLLAFARFLVTFARFLLILRGFSMFCQNLTHTRN